MFCAGEHENLYAVRSALRVGPGMDETSGAAILFDFVAKKCQSPLDGTYDDSGEAKVMTGDNKGKVFDAKYLNRDQVKEELGTDVDTSLYVDCNKWDQEVKCNIFPGDRGGAGVGKQSSLVIYGANWDVSTVRPIIPAPRPLVVHDTDNAVGAGRRDHMGRHLRPGGEGCCPQREMRTGQLIVAILVASTPRRSWPR